MTRPDARCTRGRRPSMTPSVTGGSRVRPWPAAVLLGLAVLHTWPMATDPARLSRHNDDEWLNAWTVSWVARQIVRDPLNLLDANMFYPTDDALTHTEPLIVPGLMRAPLRWFGASAMLTYNLLLLARLRLRPTRHVDLSAVCG